MIWLKYGSDRYLIRHYLFRHRGVIEYETEILAAQAIHFQFLMINRFTESMLHTVFPFLEIRCRVEFITIHRES